MRGRQCVHSPRRATVPSALPNCMAVVGVRENVVASRVVMGGEKAAPHASSATRRKRESSIADEIGGKRFLRIYLPCSFFVTWVLLPSKGTHVKHATRCQHPRVPGG